MIAGVIAIRDTSSGSIGVLYQLGWGSPCGALSSLSPRGPGGGLQVERPAHHGTRPPARHMALPFVT